jgi:hypothetical protein
MANVQIQEGFELAVSDSDKPFGSVRQAPSDSKREVAQRATPRFNADCKPR